MNKQAAIEYALGMKEANTQEHFEMFIDIAIDCIEKQIPKKPRITIHNGFCPNCENAFGRKYVEDAVIYPSWKGYCPACGQAIDWSGNE